MSRKQDPIYHVVDFFENEPVAVVRSAFSLVKRIVAKRTVVVGAAPPKRKRAKPKPPVVAAPASPAPVAVSVPSPGLPDGKAPRRRMQAAPPKPETLKDLALPGIGPTTVGD